MSIKDFYDKHQNFSLRTLSEYNISPGIKCKFDILKKNIGNKISFNSALDIGCSGNSFLYFLDNVKHNSFLDLADNPLKQYLCNNNTMNEGKNQTFHPINGDICSLPYRDKSFDLVIILDVLEHIKEDIHAIEEINRILKANGYLIVTVPHKMKYYSKQDKLIGHYRRYNIKQLNDILRKYNLKIVKTFGVYGQLFRITEIQSYRPQEIEDQIKNLRNRYESKIWFRKLWDLFVGILSFIMKIEAKYQSLDKIMNIGFIIRKIK